MRTQDKSSIFDGLSQDVALSPESVRPIYDRVLVRDLGDAEKIGSIWIPENCRDKTISLRLGIVVAVGPGDAWTEHGLDPHGDPRRRGVTIPCQACGGSKTSVRQGYIVPNTVEEFGPCDSCKGTGRQDRWFKIRDYRFEKARLPMICKPGDRIVYDRRREAEFYVNGQRLSLIHEEQSVYAVLED